MNPVSFGVCGFLTALIVCGYASWTRWRLHQARKNYRDQLAINQAQLVVNTDTLKQLAREKDKAARAVEILHLYRVWNHDEADQGDQR